MITVVLLTDIDLIPEKNNAPQHISFYDLESAKCHEYRKADIVIFDSPRGSRILKNRFGPTD